jgi:hypothetical protein
MVRVRDAQLRERDCERVSTEVRIAARARVGADIREVADLLATQ